MFIHICANFDKLIIPNALSTQHNLPSCLQGSKLCRRIVAIIWQFVLIAFALMWVQSFPHSQIYSNFPLFGRWEKLVKSGDEWPEFIYQKYARHISICLTESLTSRRVKH